MKISSEYFVGCSIGDLNSTYNDWLMNKEIKIQSIISTCMCYDNSFYCLIVTYKL